MLELVTELSSEDQLSRLVDERMLYECHFLDFKSEIDNNEKLAKNLAAFAIDGGALIVGVEEAGIARVPSLRPVVLLGLRERVDQVTKSRISPRLAIRTIEIPSRRKGHGYLVVIVPPSPDAPHMVEGRYWARNDTTKRELTDPEVRRLIQQHQVEQERSSDLLLTAELQRDPLPDDRWPHLHVIAQPLHPRQEMLWDAASRAGGWNTWVREHILPSAFRSPSNDERWSVAGRANGCGLFNPGITRDRHVELDDDGEPRRDANDLEFQDDGGLRLYSAGVTEQSSAFGPMLADKTVVRLTARLVRAAQVVTEATEYLGSWDLGVAITRLDGLPMASASARTHGKALGFSEPSYRQLLRITREALEADPVGVTTRRLLARLGRALDAEATIIEEAMRVGANLEREQPARSVDPATDAH